MILIILSFYPQPYTLCYIGQLLQMSYGYGIIPEQRDNYLTSNHLNVEYWQLLADEIDELT